MARESERKVAAARCTRQQRTGNWVAYAHQAVRPRYARFPLSGVLTDAPRSHTPSAVIRLPLLRYANDRVSRLRFANVLIPGRSNAALVSLGAPNHLSTASRPGLARRLAIGRDAPSSDGDGNGQHSRACYGWGGSRLVRIDPPLSDPKLTSTSSRHNGPHPSRRRRS